jgi:hypothetical protein
MIALFLVEKSLVLLIFGRNYIISRSVKCELFAAVVDGPFCKWNYNGLLEIAVDGVRSQVVIWHTDSEIISNTDEDGNKRRNKKEVRNLLT